jgi:outer membrane protein assembly factor BamB
VTTKHEPLLRCPAWLADRRAATAFAVIAGVFSLVVVGGVVWFGMRFRRPEHFDTELLVTSRKEIAEAPEAPASDGLRERYRAEDLRLRREHLDASARLASGGWMLLAGVGVLLLSMRRLAALTEGSPTPAARRASAELLRERKRSAVATTTVSLSAAAAALLAIVWVQAGAGPSEAVEPVPDATADIAPADIAPAEENVPTGLRWPMFRGPTGMGLVSEGEFPLTWDAATGENIVWRTKVPLPGNSSPVVWGSRVFLTGADASTRAVLAFERETGKRLWTCPVRTRPPPPDVEGVYKDTGLAPCTPATDGLRVYAFFGTTELVAVDMAGRQLWARWSGEPDSTYGISTSPVLYGGRLYLQLDQGAPDEEHSFLYALDPATGETVWETPRDVSASWSTPVVFETGERAELVTSAKPWVIAYEPDTGEELWRAKVLTGDVAPSPVYADGVVFTMTEYSQVAATRTGGEGDVTETNVLWTFDEEVSSVASPVTDGRFLVQASSYDNIVCHDVKTGEAVWRQELDEKAWSSPVLVSGLVYLTDAAGRTFVFPLAKEYEERGRGSVGEEVVASPAFAGNTIYMRGKEHLFCIGAVESRGQPE